MTPELFRSILDNTIDYVQVTSPTGEIIYTSPACERVLGVPPEQLLGRSGFERIHPEDVPRVRGELDRLLAGGRGARTSVEIRVQHADGGYRWIEGIGVNHLATPGIGGLLLVCLDVTARHEAQETLQRNERRFRAMVERSAEITTIHDRDSQIRYVSPSVEDILGYHPDEIVGHSALELTHPEDRPHVAARFRELIEGTGAVIRGQLRVRAKGGGWRWMDLVAANLLDDPAINGIVSNQHDITATREMQAELDRARRLDALGRVVAGVSHDFANVLTAVLGLAHAARRAPGDERVVGQALSDIIDAANRGVALTRQLVAFGRGQELHPHPVDLNAHLIKLDRLLHQLAGEHTDVRVELSPRRPVVEIDPGQLDQVVTNLVVNARDAMSDGGTITIRTEATDDEPPRATLMVSDTGTGMSAEVQERIFEPFFTTKPAGKGTGLGLATVFGVVTQSGGQVAVSTTPGHGTTFTVSLPLATTS